MIEGKRKLGLVSEDPAQIKVLTYWFMQANFDVITFSPLIPNLGPSLKEQNVDVIIFDLAIIESGALKIISELRSTFKEFYFPILIIPARQDLPSIINYLEAGASDFINRPIEINLLKLKILNLLKISILSQDLEKQKLDSVILSSFTNLLEMAGSVAHELGNPLTVAMGNVQIITLEVAKAKAAKDEQIKNKVFENLFKRSNIIFDSLNRIESYVGSIKAFTKRDNQIAPISIKSIIENILAISAYTLSVENIQLIKQVEKENITVLVDSTKLMQISFNIIKFFSQILIKHSGDRIIEIRETSTPQFIDLRIKANIEKPKAFEDRWYEPFYLFEALNLDLGLQLKLTKDLSNNSNIHIDINDDITDIEFIIRISKEETSEEEPEAKAS